MLRNRFQIRKQLQLHKAKERQTLMHAVQSSKVDAIITDFEKAYLAYFSRMPKVTYKDGWYKVRWMGSFRSSDLQARANEMWAELHEEELLGIE